MAKYVEPQAGEPPAGRREALADPAPLQDVAEPLPPTGSTDGPATEPSGDGSAPGGKQPPKGKAGFAGTLKELPLLLVVAFLLALLIKTFLVQAFYIPSESMTNTLQVGDRVLVNKVVYHLHPPRRGDIIVFSDPHPLVTTHRNAVTGLWHWLTEGLGVTTGPDKDFIKRVIGLPGDTVQMKRGIVFINDRRLNEPYLNPIQDLRDYGPIKVPADNLFVMGDNRTNSLDSRFSLGMIPFDKVIGRAFVIVWPPSRVQWLHGL